MQTKFNIGDRVAVGVQGPFRGQIVTVHEIRVVSSLDTKTVKTMYVTGDGLAYNEDNLMAAPPQPRRIEGWVRVYPIETYCSEHLARVTPVYRCRSEAEQAADEHSFVARVDFDESMCAQWRGPLQ